MDQPSKILVTNDDGVESRGLLALKQALDGDGRGHGRRARHQPERGRPPEDADRPLRVRERTLGDGSLAYSVDGSPTDAVSLAFLGFFGHGFDLVAAGINYGANLGDDITYSGTVSAAMEAVINNCPAFAISQEYYEHPDFDCRRARRRPSPEHPRARPLAGEAGQRQRPAIPVDEFNGFKVTRLGKRVYQDQLIERKDPRDIPYFWIGGPRRRGSPWRGPTSTPSSTGASP